MSSGTNGFIETQPKDDIRVIKFVKINGCSITPFKSCMVNVDTFTEEKSWVYNRLLTMDTQTYLEWNNDDTFLINWILAQLNLSPDPTPNNLNMNYIPENTEHHSVPSNEQPNSPKSDFIEV
jgi:hypothetical protein